MGSMATRIGGIMKALKTCSNYYMTNMIVLLPETVIRCEAQFLKFLRVGVFFEQMLDNNLKSVW